MFLMISMVTGTQRKIYSIPVSQVDLSQESFFKVKNSSNYLKRKIREKTLHGGFHLMTRRLSTGYTPLFLNVKFSQDKYKNTLFF
uniref:Uncharacterized protein n=1 Tax=Klebsiella pneumoniae TaxID=573 RepID=A0A8B0SNF8_KLEPN|nr:hypothetical protein [Klebsiella pneumoniae]